MYIYVLKILKQYIFTITKICEIFFNVFSGEKKTFLFWIRQNIELLNYIFTQ